MTGPPVRKYKPQQATAFFPCTVPIDLVIIKLREFEVVGNVDC